MRPIDADALEQIITEKFKEHYGDTVYQFIHDFFRFVIRQIRRMPTIEAEPAKHGKWDDSGRYAFGDGSLAIRCSECGCALHEDEYCKYYWNYCPNCGAKMDGGAE